MLLTEKLFFEGKKFQGGWNFGPGDQNNFSVNDLVTNMINKNGAGRYDIDKVNEKVQEAGLLKLDIAKAQNYLGWNPVLDFDETVKMTVYGYTDENNYDNLYEKRIKQINEYLSIAIKKNIAWVKNE